MTFPQFSYHSPATLATLHKYSIGTIVGHWTNLTPPIRGGVYSLISDEDTTDIDDLSDASTLCTRTTSLDIDPTKDEVRERLGYDPELDDGSQDEQTHLQVPGRRRKASARQSPILITPEAYIAKAMQGEIADSLRDYPSLDDATQRSISSAYQDLHQQVKDHGYYSCRYSEYAKEITRYLIIFSLFATALYCQWYFTSAAFLGLFWVSETSHRPTPPLVLIVLQHQIMFTAHDAGHRGITHNFVADNLIGLFIADFCCGLSLGWWKSSHNVHHLITNHPVC